MIALLQRKSQHKSSCISDIFPMVHNVKKFTIFWSSNCDVVPWSFFSIKNLGSLNGPSVGINVEKPVIFSIVVDEVSREKKIGYSFTWCYNEEKKTEPREVLNLLYSNIEICIFTSHIWPLRFVHLFYICIEMISIIFLSVLN